MPPSRLLSLLYHGNLVYCPRPSPSPRQSSKSVAIVCLVPERRHRRERRDSNSVTVNPLETSKALLTMVFVADPIVQYFLGAAFILHLGGDYTAFYSLLPWRLTTSLASTVRIHGNPCLGLPFREAALWSTLAGQAQVPRLHWSACSII